LPHFERNFLQPLFGFLQHSFTIPPAGGSLPRLAAIEQALDDKSPVTTNRLQASASSLATAQQQTPRVAIRETGRRRMFLFGV
jgi:hypothetical protein